MQNENILNIYAFYLKNIIIYFCIIDYTFDASCALLFLIFII